MKAISRLRMPFYAIFTNIAETAFAERDRWILWVPIAFGSGIACYFMLDREPVIWLAPTFLLASLSAAYLMRSVEFALFPAIALALFWAGFSVTKMRSDVVSAPVLQSPVVGMLSGRILRIEAFPGRPRVLLDELRLKRGE